VPGTDAPELTVQARLLYRKIDQYLLNFMFGEASGLTLPVTEMAYAQARIRVRPASGRAARTPADGAASPSAP
jgi:hypothetical protein